MAFMQQQISERDQRSTFKQVPEKPEQDDLSEKFASHKGATAGTIQK